MSEEFMCTTCANSWIGEADSTCPRCRCAALLSTTRIAPDFEVVAQDDAALVEMVRALADDMRERRNSAISAAHDAVCLGHSLGTALGLAQGKLEQGAFDLLLDSAHLEKGEASRLVALAKKYTLDDVRLRSDPQRQLMFALGCVPDKEEVKHEGNASVDIRSGIGTAVNAWHKFKRDVEMKRALLIPRIVKAETHELYQWLKEIHEKGGE